MPPPEFLCDCFHKTWANLETDWNLKSMIAFFSEKIIPLRQFNTTNGL
jgi:hypothetical protein